MIPLEPYVQIDFDQVARSNTFARVSIAPDNTNKGLPQSRPISLRAYPYIVNLDSHEGGGGIDCIYDDTLRSTAFNSSVLYFPKRGFRSAGTPLKPPFPPSVLRIRCVLTGFKPDAARRQQRKRPSES